MTPSTKRGNVLGPFGQEEAVGDQSSCKVTMVGALKNLQQILPHKRFATPNCQPDESQIRCFAVNTINFASRQFIGSVSVPHP